jgi:hypothetical protein
MCLRCFRTAKNINAMKYPKRNGQYTGIRNTPEKVHRMDIAMTNVVCFQNANSVRLRSMGRSSPFSIVYGFSVLVCGCTCCDVEIILIRIW